MTISRLLIVAALALASIACGGKSDNGANKSSGQGGANADNSNREGQSAVEQGVPWTTLPFEEALQKAAAENAQVLVDVWSASCAQCGVMDEEVWNTAEGVRLVGNAIPIKVPSDAPESYPFRHRYPITGLPAVLLLDSNGDEINRVVGYVNKTEFLTEAHTMMTGIDPIPDLEKEVAAHPENLALQTQLMEKYLDRTREAEARALMDRILEKDPDSAAGEAEKAVRYMARYYAFFRMDAAGSAEYYRTYLDRFPGASGVGGALKATLDQAKASGSVDDWIQWICKVAEKHDDHGRFNSSVAMFAHRNHLKGRCLADAARRALRLGGGAAGLDTVAVALEKG